jgi:uroporphyrinogen decarboxylase
MVAEPEKVAVILDQVLEIKKAYWSNVIRAVGDEVSVFFEADDFAGQHGNLVRPRVYVELLMPRHAQLVRHIKSEKPDAIVFLHSCGSIVDLLPHFIDAGFDVINPVQVSAKGMDTAWLKKEYGERIVFWGGGVDTQQVLPRGRPEEVKAEVNRRIQDLAPGGGFVFNPVHNVQPDVPPRNLEAMWEAYKENSRY